MSGSLQHGPNDILRYLLIGLGGGLVVAPTTPPANPAPDWIINVGFEPTSPDNCITVFNTSPILDGRTHPDGETQQHDGIQIRVRSLTEPVGYAKCNAITTALDAILRSSVVIGSSQYLVQSVSHRGILYLGKEEGTSRRIHTINVVMSVRQVS